MSNSRLATYIDVSNENWSYRVKDVSKVLIFQIPRKVSIEQLATIQNIENSLSWNYGISADGNIGLFVEETHRANTFTHYEKDDGLLAIGVASSGNSTRSSVAKQSYEALLNLCEDICRRNAVTKLTYKSTLLYGGCVNPASYNTTYTEECYLKSKMQQIAKTVTSRLAKPTTIKYPSFSGSTSYSVLTSGESLIDTTQFTPYVITTSRSTRNLDYVGLKNMGVIGVVFECGCYFDAAHMPTDLLSYRNPKLKQQVNAATAATMKYGLWHPIKSRNVNEAKKELAALLHTLRLYDPDFGIWLKLNMPNTKSRNDEILKLYCSTLKSAGFSNKMGIYCTKSQLKSQITWDSHYNDFWLWIDNHLGTMKDVGQLLTPAFFDTSN